MRRSRRSDRATRAPEAPILLRRQSDQRCRRSRGGFRASRRRHVQRHAPRRAHRRRDCGHGGARSVIHRLAPRPSPGIPAGGRAGPIGRQFSRDQARSHSSRLGAVFPAGDRGPDAGGDEPAVSVDLFDFTSAFSTQHSELLSKPLNPGERFAVARLDFKELAIGGERTFGIRLAFV